MRISDWSSDVCSSDLCRFSTLCKESIQRIGSTSMPKVRSVRDGSCWTSFDSFYLPIFTNIRRLVDMRKMISALGIAAATFCFSSVSLAAEQSYPSRPVTLVVPWNAGGSVDMTARRIGEAMAKQGFSVIVETSRSEEHTSE